MEYLDQFNYLPVSPSMPLHLNPEVQYTFIQLMNSLQKKRPRGDDAFSLEFGDSMNPTYFSGIVWYRDDDNVSWSYEPGDYMSPTSCGLQSCTYAGNQKGGSNEKTKTRSMFFAIYLFRFCL